MLTLWPLLPGRYPCLIGDIVLSIILELTSLVLGHCMKEGGGAGSHACLQQY